MKKFLVGALAGAVVGSIELPSFSNFTAAVSEILAEIQHNLPYILPSQSPLIWALTLAVVVIVVGVYAAVMSFTTEFIDSMLRDFQLSGKELVIISAGTLWPIAWPVMALATFLFACVSVGAELAEQS